MSGGRWFATGPDFTAPSSAGPPGAAVERGRARARFYGSAVVYALDGGRVVPMVQLTRADDGVILEVQCEKL